MDTPLKKAGAAAITALGGGLVIHGVRNVACAFNPTTDQHLQVEELGQKAGDGINWTQLAVGTGEAILGSAVIYRSLTGRWGTGAVEGHVDRFFNCEHGQDQGHGLG